MQHPYYTTKYKPAPDETLIHNREEGLEVLAKVDRALAGKLSRNERAVKLCARALIHEALGLPTMLETAQDAYAFSKTSQTCQILAVALHYHGRIKECLEFHERAYRYPHQPGLEIDIDYALTLLYRGKWSEGRAILKNIKKRTVYAYHLKDWQGDKVPELSIVGEGGFGDLINYARWIPLIRERGINPTLYLTPYHMSTSFADYARTQPWFCEIKPLNELPLERPAVGVFDLFAVFDVQPDDIPAPAPWNTEFVPYFAFDTTLSKPKFGLCWSAQSTESPIMAPGVYRSLTEDQVQKVIHSTSHLVDWVNLQFGTDTPGTILPKHKTWQDTADIIGACDVVVSVDTSIIHLAASMGKPTWMMLSGASDWRWGIEGTTTAWYPTVRMFRNNAFGFENVVNNLVAAITQPEAVLN